MTSVLLFPTSEKVTVEIVEDLNKNCSFEGPPFFYNSFNPARHRLEDIAPESRTPIKFGVDVFQGKSDEDLRELFATIYDALDGPKYDFGESTFAVLDERGVQERTIVIHNRDYEFDDYDRPIKPGFWRTWRLHWQNAVDAIEQFEGESMEVVMEMLVKCRDTCIGDDGIFDYQKALKESGYGDDGPKWIPE